MEKIDINQKVTLARASWSNEDIQLKYCPFCGGVPKIRHIGNEQSKKRSIEISCTKCFIKRKQSAISHNFKWLEEYMISHWNKRIFN